MAAIVDYGDEAVVSITLDGTVTTWNPAAERMFGYAGKEIAGKSGSLLSPADRKDERPSLPWLAQAGPSRTLKPSAPEGTGRRSRSG